MFTRRQFNQMAAATMTVAAALTGCVTTRRPSLRILVLGGTQFVGVHVVNEALSRGHRVTLFNRGRTNTDLFPKVEKLQGDREGQLEALRGHEWDSVIDLSGNVPDQVGLSTAMLAAAASQYLFMSSTDAYASFAKPNSESSPLSQLAATQPSPNLSNNYGAFKAMSEAIVRKAFANGAIILRPSMIVGPFDPASRIAYWLACIARGAPFPAPGTRYDAIQFVDARDLARFALDALEARKHGTYNVASSPGQFTMGALIAACTTAWRRLARLPSSAQAVWLPRQFLERQQAARSFPLWPGRADELGLAQINTRSALTAGLRISDIEMTARDTLAWCRTQAGWQEAALARGLDAAKQQSLLAAWADSGAGA